MEYSIVENGVVINVVVADSALGSNWHEGNHGIGALFVAGVFTQKPQSIVNVVLTFDQLKTAKISAIRTHFGAMVDGLKADAAPYEVETWGVQNAEYSAWTANNTTPTPYVSALAAARGMTISVLMAKIGVKVAGLATIQGMQQALEDAVKAATTQAALDLVVV